MKVPGIHVYDSVTTLLPEGMHPSQGPVWGAIVIAASHGGRYAAYLAALAGVKGIVLNDAGVGRDRAGVSGLALLDDCGIAGAVISHLSARIGDGKDAAWRGRISAVNHTAGKAGVQPGMSAMDAARLMVAGGNTPTRPPPLPAEARAVLQPPGARRRLVLIDSVSLAHEEDAGAVVVTGSHGGLQGGDPATAIGGHAVFAAAYNDAGIGVDGAGATRLPALERQGVAGVTVAAESARIGDARSTYRDGIISCANPLALSLGARAGMPLMEFVARLLEARV
ncbi:hypothetical protein [Parapusillimonas granuli]|uniref:Uncharacterized protein n=1 Tax=Parapusillimonas granuli TaxID=380911 RepID=A0A853FVM5_9BURK|nr:hypothetical protein [Parapusillimonas granuli]MBB5216091.1 hypothetical protein [Parapusillimonas granuli]NYT47772.1 hypothetical protein [Parapusillimonas granuli]